MPIVTENSLKLTEVNDGDALLPICGLEAMWMLEKLVIVDNEFSLSNLFFMCCFSIAKE